MIYAVVEIGNAWSDKTRRVDRLFAVCYGENEGGDALGCIHGSGRSLIR